MLTSEIRALRARCLRATRRGYSIALSGKYMADLESLLAGGVALPQGSAKGSAAHLLALCDAALAGGGKKASKPKAEAPKAEAPKAEAPKAEAPKAEAPKAEEPVSPYEGWTKAALVAEAEARRIDSKLNKEKLIAALQADDALSPLKE